MLQVALQYYFRCVFLWDICSAFHYVFDDAMTADLSNKSKLWFSKQTDLANWLTDEAEFVLDGQDIPPNISKKIYETAEVVGDANISQWAEKLRSFSVQFSNEYSQFNELTHLYYCYCLWLLKAIIKFQELSEKSNSESNKFHSHYTDSIAKFGELRDLLVEERPNLADKQKNDALWVDMDELTSNLVGDWKQVTEKMTKKAMGFT